MRKYLVFYPLENELGLGRHAFDAMTDEEAWKKLDEVEGVRVYDMTRSDRNGQMLDMGDFVEDYNDEELDGGWWSIVLTLPEKREEVKELDYPRDFKKSERVCYEDEDGVPHKAMISCDQQARYEDDEVEIFIFHDEEDDDSQGIELKFVKAKGVYQLSDDRKSCPKCGEPLYDEHLPHMDYPYYCPWCQENFYGIEVQ